MDIVNLARIIESDCRASLLLDGSLLVKPVSLPYNEYFDYIRGTKTAEELFPVVTRAVRGWTDLSNTVAQKYHVPEIPSQEEIRGALDLARPELERLAEGYQHRVS